MGSNKEPIEKITLKSGGIRYELVVDLPPDPKQPGKRNQIRRRFKQYKEARAELSRIRHETNTSTLVRPSKRTLNDELDSWLAGRRKITPATRRNNQDALRPAREFLGERPLQELDKSTFDDLVVFMETSGRKRGGKVGTGLGARSIQLTLNTLQQALDIAVAEKRIQYNPLRLVERPKASKPEHTLWADAEEERFFALAERDRLAAVIELFGRGLRPEELCGIREADLDLKAKHGLIGKHVRTMVEGKPVEKEAKSEAGIRTLPLDKDLNRKLKAWKAKRAAEKMAAGDAYEDGGYVLCDELGRPWLPDKLRRYMRSMMKQAGVRQVTPYEAMRHAAGSRMARAKVPGHVIAAWMGHANASFTYDNYVHARPEDLVEARDALNRAKSA